MGDGPCFPPGALAGGGSRGAGTGAACAELRSPARTAAAARRLQWSSAPQPLLSHGRGALAGRRSGLPAPRLLFTRQTRSIPRARGCPAACPPHPLLAGSSVYLVPGRRPREPEGYRDRSPGRTCSGQSDPPASPVQQWCEPWPGEERPGKTAAFRPGSGGKGLHPGTAAWRPPLSKTKPLALGALPRPHSINKHYVPTVPRTPSPGGDNRSVWKEEPTTLSPWQSPAVSVQYTPSHLETSMLKLFLARVQDQIDLKANLHGGTR